MYQHFPLQRPPKFTQIWIFGLEANYLASLVLSDVSVPISSLSGDQEFSIEFLMDWRDNAIKPNSGPKK
jgi:hypothetical protein